MLNSAQRSLVKAFEPSSCAAACGRPEGLDAGLHQIVHETCDEGRFRPHHHEVDRHGAAEVDDRLMVGYIERHIGAMLRRAGIAGGDQKPVAERARGKGPGKSMLAAAGTDQKNVHAVAPSHDDASALRASDSKVECLLGDIRCSSSGAFHRRGAEPRRRPFLSLKHIEPGMVIRLAEVI